MGANNDPWENLAEPARSELRAVYEDLGAEVGLPKRLAVRWAKLTAETWATTDAVSQEAAVLAVRRKTGRGRRPTRQVVAQAAKRQALQVETLSRALRQLGELAGRNGANGHHGDDDLSRAIMAMPPVHQAERS